jgi:hypothetical protein
LLYLDGAIVVAGRRGTQFDGRDFLDRFAAGGPEILAEFPAAMNGLAPYADGFVVLRHTWVTRRDAEYGDIDTIAGPSELFFCDPHGQTLRRAFIWTSDGGQGGLGQVVVDPGSGRLAIHGHGVQLYAPFAEQRIAQSWQVRNFMCFLGPGRFVVVARSGTLQMWHLLGGRLVRQPMRRRVPRDHGVASIVAVPQRGELAVLIRKMPEEPGFVRYFDTDTLTEVEGQHGLAGKTGHELWSSRQGSAHALASEDGAIDIAFATHPLAPLLGRPMGDMTSSDLAAVAGSLGRHDQFPAERPALELLRACLEYRFGADVAIGDAPAPGHGTDDIALSAEP